MKREHSQVREETTGRYGFEGDWGRLCVCGHELGVHTAAAPHECMNADRRVMATDGAWFNADIPATTCNCMKFRPTRKRKAALANPGED